MADQNFFVNQILTPIVYSSLSCQFENWRRCEHREILNEFNSFSFIGWKVGYFLNIDMLLQVCYKFFNRGITIFIVAFKYFMWRQMMPNKVNHSILPCIFCISSVIRVFLSLRFSISSSTFLFCRSTMSRFLLQLLQPFRWYSVIDSSEID